MKFITQRSLCLVLQFAGTVNHSTISNVWKKQKDFGRKILSHWPSSGFTIGGKYFNYKQNFAITVESLETEIIFITIGNVVKQQ